MRAYVLIEVTPGRVTNLVESLEAREGVIEVDRITGPYDVIVVLEARDVVEIGEIIETELHPLSGVARTTTLLALP